VKCTHEQRWPAIPLLLAVWVACIGSAAAQDRRVPVKVGELWSGSEVQAEPYRRPYLEGMRALGWVDGQSMWTIVRYNNGDPSKFPALAAELVSLGVDVLVVTDRALPAARNATARIPIVCLDMFDPVAQGATSNLARPEGNVTGVSWQSVETADKRLELAKELLPGLRRVALLTDAGDPGAIIEAKGLGATAAAVGIRLRTFAVRRAEELPAVFAALKRDRPEALIVSTNPLTNSNIEAIVRFASSSKLPTIGEAKETARAGFLLTYGADVSDTYRRGAIQVDRILRGMKPGDVPFEQPTKFELVVNLRTAKALGLKVSQLIMMRATEVIR
jgi:putative ABC transport system substrate-binding protein